jgi:cytochrome c553
MKSKYFCSLVFLISSSLFFLPSAGAGDSKEGQKKAAQCAVCHGANGMATLAEAPNLAGQSEIYLSEQLRHYRDGQRRHEVMGVIAKPLSNADIEDLAAWFNSIRVEVTLPN